MKETLTNRLLINTQDWDHIWKERDLRRAGLLGVPIEGNYASRLRVSSHEVARARDTADDVYDAFEAEARRQSWRTTMSSDLTGKDGGKYFSIETLTQQRLVLSRSSSQRNDSDLPEGPGSHQVQLECSSTLPRSMATFEKKLVSKCYASLTLYI
jgi:hypothetical protein